MRSALGLYKVFFKKMLGRGKRGAYIQYENLGRDKMVNKEKGGLDFYRKERECR